MSIHRELLIAAIVSLHVAEGLKTFVGHDASLEATIQLKRELSNKILKQFTELDRDGDGSVTKAELHAGFGGEVGEEAPRAESEIHDRMLQECGGAGAPCKRGDLEAAVYRWRDVSTPFEAQYAMAYQQALAAEGFAELTDVTGGDCGAGGMDAAEGGEKLKCKWTGQACLPSNPLLAWSVPGTMCNMLRACICEPTSYTKRLVKVGLAGAIAVGTVKNYTDANETLRTPDCGDGWEAIKHVDWLDVRKPGLIDATVIRFAAEKVLGAGLNESATKDIVNLTMSVSEDGTEVGLFKTASHQVSRGGPKQKVCMMSWQATRSYGDWKTNMMITPEQFAYAPRGHIMPLLDGMSKTYASVRDSLKARFEAECCNDDFTADQVIISGHSHGGAMAELHAIDVVTNWKCGRDLGTKDLAVVLIAPHKINLLPPTMTKVFSCKDFSKCLAGRTAVIYHAEDAVGDPGVPYPGNIPMPNFLGIPWHPSKPVKVTCPSIPANADNRTKRGWWCHNAGNYRNSVEEELVDAAGWGSSCGGVCGDPNPTWQCNEIVMQARIGCNYMDAETMKGAIEPTHCPATAWNPDKEKCECPLDSCVDLTPNKHCGE